ncbi:MAG: hypothetical protein HZB30_04160 [Nitrospirae bacterium]|nr:hypothetical protein [Nitrospirota bacterium]
MKARKDMVRMGTKVGAAFGAIGFLLVGLIPGFYFGSYGTLVLLNHLFGGPLEATVLVRVAIAVGIILGIACVASVSIVVGAVVGTIAGYASEAVTNAVSAKPSSEEHASAEVK